MKKLSRIVIALALALSAYSARAWTLDVNASEPDFNVYAQDQIVVAIQTGNADCMVTITDTESGEDVAGVFFLYTPGSGYRISTSRPIPSVKINGGAMGQGMEIGFSNLPEGRNYRMTVVCPDLEQEASTPAGYLDFGGCQFYSWSSSSYCVVNAYIGDLTFKRLDLRSYFPRPQDQGNWQQSCVSWAVSVARTYQLAKLRNQTNVSDPSVQLSPAYLYNQLAPNGGDTYVQDNLNILRLQGCATLSEMPYNVTADPSRYANQWPTTDQTASAARNRTTGFSWYFTDNNIEETKQALEAGNPVIIGVWVNVPDGVGWHWVHRGVTWYNPIGYYTYEPYVRYVFKEHAVCLVGYDDSRSTFIAIDSLTIDYKARGIDFTGWPVDGIKNDVHACYRDIPYSEAILWTCVMTQEF